MAGKSKGKGKKKKEKKEKKGDGSKIASAIMPSLTMTASPHIPFPVPENTEGLQSTSVLNSSLLGRMFATPEPRDDPSETDTSLYDYENARNTMPALRCVYLFQSIIAPALFPPVAFVGVPHIPSIPHLPPPVPRGRVRSGVLSAGTLPLATGSSFDLESMQDDEIEGGPGYSTVGEMGRAIPSPPTGFADLDSDTEPFSSSPPRDLYSYARPLPTRGDNIPDPDDPLYSLPYEARPSKDRSYMSDPDDSFHGLNRSSHDFSQGGSTLRASRESRRSTGSADRTETLHAEQTEDSIPKTEVVEIYSVPMRRKKEPKSCSQENLLKAQVDSFRSPDRSASLHNSTQEVDVRLSMTSSLRLQSLKQQNQQLLDKQSQLEQQLQQQQKAQDELMARLQRQGFLAVDHDDVSVQEMGSVIQETTSLTSKTTRKHEEYVDTFRERAQILEAEKQELNDLNQQLQAEVLSYKRMSSFRDDDESGGTRNLLKKQLMDYKDENDTLKSAVQRHSAELARYHSMFRPLSAVELDELPGLPSKGPKPSWLVNTKYLAPLFVAYDDRLEEKDRLFKQCQGDLEHFKQQIDTVLKENQRLHIRLEQTDVSGPLGMTEWRSLQEQCKLVLEENQLLMEQLDVKENKGRDMHRAHVHEGICRRFTRDSLSVPLVAVSILSKRLVTAEAERSEAEQEVRELKTRLTDLKKSHDKLAVDNKARPELEDHLNTVSGIKKLLEEEQLKHSEEIENLHAKVQTLVVEKRDVSIQLEDLQLENKRLQNDLRGWHKAQRKLEKKIVLLKMALDAVEHKELRAERYLTTVVRMAEKTAEENNSLSQAVTDQESERKAVITKLLARDACMGKLEDKLQQCKLKATEKLEKAALRMKEQDNDFSQQKHEYERQLQHLRLMVQEKQDLLSTLNGEKRAVEDDLETMWQVASHDNQEMKGVVRRALRKLKNYDSMKEELDESEKT
ncbi:hypothetical protein CAPTEDRAFT_223993 [Capitella teleta]|uniref:Centrosomal protein of 89 kDa n=1 Tax=Capitella teleta TaxID=283909 RepID=R7TI79_CAPTE|nr:hypothetical protein CAPTEDRAFT_223993 [Capitella teleta]|eukprot:ELT93187.1 hypothetical protein CAPTEDRAFT_223993 [Capitella teleta]